MLEENLGWKKTLELLPWRLARRQPLACWHPPSWLDRVTWNLVSQVLSPYKGGAFTTSPGSKSSVYGEELQVFDFWVTDPLEINICGSTSSAQRAVQ